jgi:hypothetical protein
LTINPWQVSFLPLSDSFHSNRACHFLLTLLHSKE